MLRLVFFEESNMTKMRLLNSKFTARPKTRPWFREISHHTDRRKWRPSWRSGFGSFVIHAGLAMALAAIAAVKVVNATDTVGFAGTVGTLAGGISLSCGGQYQPLKQVVVFTPALPCGTQVRLTAENGQSVTATVASNTVMYRGAPGRIADISVAAATALGLNPRAKLPARLSMRTMHGGWRGILDALPTVAAFQPHPQPPHRPPQADVTPLALNMRGECSVCGPWGEIAVSQVVLNRMDAQFNRKRTVHDVVYDSNQFSWVDNNVVQLRPQEVTLAQRVLMGMLSGNELAVQYLITSDATYYYAPDVIKTPKWGLRGGKLEPVPMLNSIEVELRHRFFREKQPDDERIRQILAEG